MALEPKGDIRRSGYERHEVHLAYGEDDMADVEKLTSTGDVIPEEFVLVWERDVGEKWTRHWQASRAFGRVKMLTAVWEETPEVRRSRLLYDPQLRELRRWATLLPGLHQAISQAESGLPD